MEHKYLQNDRVPNLQGEDTSDLAKVSCVLLCALMCHEDPEFYSDLKYFLAMETRKGICQHRVSNPSASIEAQNEFNHLLHEMYKDLNSAIKELVSSSNTIKEVKKDGR
jgi:hypothetical protein